MVFQSIVIDTNHYIFLLLQKSEFGSWMLIYNAFAPWYLKPQCWQNTSLWTLYCGHIYHAIRHRTTVAMVQLFIHERHPQSRPLAWSMGCISCNFLKKCDRDILRAHCIVLREFILTSPYRDHDAGSISSRWPFPRSCTQWYMKEKTLNMECHVCSIRRISSGKQEKYGKYEDELDALKVAQTTLNW